MNDREQAMQLLKDVPEFKIDCVIAYLQGIIAGARRNEPNAETLEAFAEVDAMKSSGGGEHFTGTTDELFSSILEGSEC